MAEVISVSALNRYVKNLLDVNDVLFDLALTLAASSRREK